MPEITQQEKQQELEALLASGIFDKAPNVQRFLEFVAEKHFSGEEVKEYQIAVEALHRTSGFNPQSDTIVRVTAHSLRRRLDQYYSTDGGGHAIHIQLPTGKYAMRFVPANEPTEEELAAPQEPPYQPPPASAPPVPKRHRAWPRAVAVLLVLMLAILFVAYRARTSHPAPASQTATSPSQLPVTPVASAAEGATVRFLAGDGRAAYTDPSGQVWAADHYCSSGVTLPVSNHRIQGAEEGELFRSGRRGNIHCQIPAAKDNYELHLFFADTEGTQENTRNTEYRVNGGAAQVFDVVDLAGGNDTATERIVTGVHPTQDGNVHLDFNGEGSIVNAIELVPSPSPRMLPIRMHIGPVAFHDGAGNIWSPDRFYSGGRRVFHPEVVTGQPDPRLFQWERYGHFHYSIPVVAGRQYTVTLYFKEAWFGAPNGIAGGVGSRVFDVYGDGATLLSNFDIVQSQKDGVSKMAFHHVHPSGLALIDLYFSPVRNYALVNAIEIEEEE